MRKFLGDNGGRLDMDFNDLPDELITYTVIRNPLERFVSGMFETFKRTETDSRLRDLRSIPNKKELMEAYLNVIDEYGFLDVHITPQSYFLSDYRVDYILKFEELSKGFNLMCEQIGVDGRLGHVNQRNKADYNNAMAALNSNPELKARINELYQKDWDIYNSYDANTMGLAGIDAA